MEKTEEVRAYVAARQAQRLPVEVGVIQAATGWNRAQVSRYLQGELTSQKETGRCVTAQVLYRCRPAHVPKAMRQAEEADTAGIQTVTPDIEARLRTLLDARG